MIINLQNLYVDIGAQGVICHEDIAVLGQFRIRAIT